MARTGQGAPPIQRVQNTTGTLLAVVVCRNRMLCYASTSQSRCHKNGLGTSPFSFCFRPDGKMRLGPDSGVPDLVDGWLQALDRLYCMTID